MRAWLRKWWPLYRAVLALAILVAIGRRFARDLESPELWQLSLRPEWLVLAAILYVLGLMCSGLYWYRLLVELGQRPSLGAALRAYYIGHLGKYLPGKAWALLMRVNLVRSPRVRLGVSILTTFYEVLATMAGGVLLAAILFAFLGPESSTPLDWNTLRALLTLQSPQDPILDRRLLVLLALTLLGAVGIPILPPVFNRLVYRLSVLKHLAARQSGPNTVPFSLPRVHWYSLLEGLLFTSLGWIFLGASLVAVLKALLSQAPPWDWAAWGYCTAGLTVACVAGFVIVLVPGGLGVREFFLTLFLVPALGAMLTPAESDARALTVLTVLLLRLIWTAAELVIAGIVYWLPSPVDATMAAIPESSEILPKS